MYSGENKKLFVLTNNFMSEITTHCLRFSGTVTTEALLVCVLHVQHVVYRNGIYFNLRRED